MKRLTLCYAMSVKRLAMSRRPSGLDCRNTVPAEAERRSVDRLACASAVVGRSGGPATVEKPGHDDLGGGERLEQQNLSGTPLDAHSSPQCRSLEGTQYG
jgi:hypothetical protein